MMIKLIHGGKGVGKTKEIIRCVNAEITSARGEHIYITDKLMHTMDIDRRVRFVNIMDYGVNSSEAMAAFVKGMLAANSDITRIYIDGINRFVAPPQECESLLQQFEAICTDFKVKFTLTISTDNLPEFMLRYV